MFNNMLCRFKVKFILSGCLLSGEKNNDFYKKYEWEMKEIIATAFTVKLKRERLTTF